MAFYYCFSSLAERLAAARSGQGRAVWWRGDSAPLDGEDRCDIIRQGEEKLNPRATTSS
jgi:hypothetical protein